MRAEEEKMKRDREAQWLARVQGWVWYTRAGSLCEYFICSFHVSEHVDHLKARYIYLFILIGK